MKKSRSALRPRARPTLLLTIFTCVSRHVFLLPVPSPRLHAMHVCVRYVMHALDGVRCTFVPCGSCACLLGGCTAVDSILSRPLDATRPSRCPALLRLISLFTECKCCRQAYGCRSVEGRAECVVVVVVAWAGSIGVGDITQ